MKHNFCKIERRVGKRSRGSTGTYMQRGVDLARAQKNSHWVALYATVTCFQNHPVPQDTEVVLQPRKSVLYVEIRK